MAPVQTKQDLIGRLRRRHDDLRRLGVRRLGVFGSFQRDAPTEESDVDLLVEFVPGEKSFDHFMSLSFLLEEELGRPVELMTREALSPHFGPHILEDVEYVGRMSMP
jgi:predicted nucleotidyltransferase